MSRVSISTYITSTLPQQTSNDGFTTVHNRAMMDKVGTKPAAASKQSGKAGRSAKSFKKPAQRPVKMPMVPITQPVIPFEAFKQLPAQSRKALLLGPTVTI
jgi:hypothetical protein